MEVIANGYLVNGLIALALSLVVWHVTDSFWGWLALFAPGSVLVAWGWYVALKS